MENRLSPETSLNGWRKLGSPLVRLGEQWLELDPAQVQAARQFMDRNDSTGSMPLLQAVGLAQAFSPDGQKVEQESRETLQFDVHRTSGLTAGREGSPLQNLAMAPRSVG